MRMWFGLAVRYSLSFQVGDVKVRVLEEIDYMLLIHPIKAQNTPTIIWDLFAYLYRTIANIYGHTEVFQQSL